MRCGRTSRAERRATSSHRSPHTNATTQETRTDGPSRMPFVRTSRIRGVGLSWRSRRMHASHRTRGSGTARASERARRCRSWSTSERSQHILASQFDMCVGWLPSGASRTSSGGISCVSIQRKSRSGYGTSAWSRVVPDLRFCVGERGDLLCGRPSGSAHAGPRGTAHVRTRSPQITCCGDGRQVSRRSVTGWSRRGIRGCRSSCRGCWRCVRRLGSGGSTTRGRGRSHRA